MIHRFVARLFSQWKRSCPPAARPRRYRLALEALEDRLVMDALPPPPPPPPPPSPDGPIAVDDGAAYFFDHAAPIIGDIYANDTDPNPGATIVPGSIVIVTPPQFGTALPDPSTGLILYTPNTIPANQQDTFTYQVRDTLDLVSNIATVTLSPVGGLIADTHLEAHHDLANTVSLQAVSVNPLLNDVVTDGTFALPSSVTIVTPPLHGSAVVNPATGVVTYTPDFGFVGFETLNYTVRTPLSDHDSGALIFIAVYPSVPRLQADPLGGAMLVVDGTQGNDTIRFDRGKKPTGVNVTINGVTFGPFTPSSRIVTFGYAGADQITVGPHVKLPVWMDGGDSNDVLRGGSGPNVILGRAGNDLLIGGAARDLLIGGTGRDVLFGNRGGDILIAGSTSFDNSQRALDAIMKEWTSTHSYQQRVSNLTGVPNSKFGKRLNGNVFLVLATVKSDDGGNVAVGGRGRDLFFVNDTGPNADFVVDQTRHERGNR